jgi:prepilin peptidase CpaA
MKVEYLIIFTALLLTLISAISDIKTAKIRNELFVIGVVLGLAFNTIGNGWNGFLYAMLGAVLPIIVFLPLSSNHFHILGFHGIKVIGMGDIKLFSFVGALICFPNIIKVIALTYIFGGIYALIVMIYKKLLLARLKYFGQWLIGYALTRGNHKYISEATIKFAPFVFCAVCTYFAYGWFTA